MENGLTDGQVKKFLETATQKGVTPDHFNKLLESGILADVLSPSAQLDREAVRKALKLEPVGARTFTLKVNYDLGLEGMIRAGDYFWVAPMIYEFKVRGKGVRQFEAQLVHFKRPMFPKVTLSEVQALDRNNPWEPAKIQHLLAFGDRYPEEQCEYQIVALGSVLELGWWRSGGGDSYWAALDSSVRSRSLSAYVASSSAQPKEFSYLVVRSLKSAE